jgi:hypothetical protein
MEDEHELSRREKVRGQAKDQPVQRHRLYFGEERCPYPML